MQEVKRELRQLLLRAGLRDTCGILALGSLTALTVREQTEEMHFSDFEEVLKAGVEETFCVLYRRNFRKALELISGVLLTDAQMNGLSGDLRNRGYVPVPPEEAEYYDRERWQLKAALGCVEDELKKAQEFARRHALEETETETREALELLQQCLSCQPEGPRVRADCGLDTAWSGRMLTRQLLQTASEAVKGETGPVPVFQIRRGISAGPEDPNGDLFCFACSCRAAGGRILLAEDLSPDKKEPGMP